MFFESRQTIDFREVRRMLWRRRLIIGLPAAVTVLAAAIGSLLMEPKYDSVATLAIERPVTLTREVRAATGDNRRESGKQSVRTFRSRILASSFLESVAVQIGLHENEGIIAKVDVLHKEHPRHTKQDLLLRECVSKLERMLDIRSDGGDIFHIRVVSRNPSLAYRVASTTAEQYIQTTRQGRLRQSEEAHNFAQEQMAIYETKLEEKRRQLREYEQKVALKPLSSSPVSATNINRVNTMIAAADADLEFLTGQLEGSGAKIEERGLAVFLELDSIQSERLRALKETLFEQELHYALALVEYEDKTPPVMAAGSQIAVKSQQVLGELESVAEMAFPTLVDENRQTLVDHAFTQIKIEAADRRKREFRSFLDRYAKDLANVPAEEFRLNRMKEEVRSAERLYDTWLEQANSTQIAKAVQSASVGNQITLIEEARLPLHPFAPDRKSIVMLAMMMGLAIGLGAAVLMEYLDLTLKSVGDIEATLGVPILGAVPRTQAAVLRDEAQGHQRRIRMVIVSAVLTAALLGAFGYYYFFLSNAGIS